MDQSEVALKFDKVIVSKFTHRKTSATTTAGETNGKMKIKRNRFENNSAIIFLICLGTIPECIEAPLNLFYIPST